ncbi:MAG TPA: type VI secretion system baseplate subunit TssG [Telluria sp.]
MHEIFDEPARFDFFQVVREMERTLAAAGADPATAVRDHIRFPNSTSLGAAAGEVADLSVEGVGHPTTVHELVQAIRAGDIPRVRITPTFIGMLGVHGTLPLHYTEAVNDAGAAGLGEARLAFLDALSSRLVSLFYEAWKAQRFELAADGDSAAIRPRLLALAASQGNENLSECVRRLETYYAGLLRHRPVSAVVIEQVLSHYFDMPVEVQPGVQTRHPVPAPFQAQLGGSTLSASSPCVLGSHMHRRDVRCAIVLHPQTREKAHEFSRPGPGARELRKVLGLFAVSTTEFEVSVVIAKEQVEGARLDGTCALGLNSYLLSGPAMQDRADMRYMVRPGEGVDTDEPH